MHVTTGTENFLGETATTMRHLIIGASGQVGGHLWRRLRHQATEEVMGTYFSHPEEGQRALDFTDGVAVRQLLERYQPDVLWMPAAMPDVDRCEKDPALSYRLNVEAPCQVGELARDIQAKVVFFSTDYVFDGTAGPYKETDDPNPLQVYGRHKVQTETFLLQHVPSTLLIRPAWVYSNDPNPRNFVFRIVEQLKSGNIVNAAVDQVNTPTDSDDLIQRALTAVHRGDEGIRHIVGPKRLNRYDLTISIAREHGYAESLVKPITTTSLNLAAKRPLDGGLVTIFP